MAFVCSFYWRKMYVGKSTGHTEEKQRESKWGIGSRSTLSPLPSWWLWQGASLNYRYLGGRYMPCSPFNKRFLEQLPMWTSKSLPPWDLFAASPPSLPYPSADLSAFLTSHLHPLSCPLLKVPLIRTGTWESPDASASPAAVPPLLFVFIGNWRPDVLRELCTPSQIETEGKKR